CASYSGPIAACTRAVIASTCSTSSTASASSVTRPFMRSRLCAKASGTIPRRFDSNRSREGRKPITVTSSALVAPPLDAEVVGEVVVEEVAVGVLPALAVHLDRAHLALHGVLDDAAEEGVEQPLEHDDAEHAHEHRGARDDAAPPVAGDVADGDDEHAVHRA